MAGPEPLSPQVLQGIAAQITERLPVMARAAARDASSGLGESLRIVMLPYDAIEAGEGPLEQRVIDTGQWHHQVYLGNRPVTFARSVPQSSTPGAAHDVVELSQSSLPQALSDTINWVDQNRPEEAIADILLVPAFALAAIWIHSDQRDEVVVSSAAPGMRKLDLNHPIPSDEFLRRLSQNEPIAGLGPPEEARGQNE